MASCWHPSRRVLTRLGLMGASGPLNLHHTAVPRRISAQRTFATATEPSKDGLCDSELSPKHDIYVSGSTDPYFNLTLEDWLFRHSPASSPLLLVYRDSPCVVIGRHQNPWTEINFRALRTAGIPFIRRRSGGGTVYHDFGNTNFSIHLPRSSFDRHATGDIILRAVQSLGIDARLNDRNDICVGPDKMSDDWALDNCFHLHGVSGSAYKIISQRAYHHGTMLITTRLDQLGDALRPEKRHIVTKSVASVRSPVCNLQQHSSKITHETFTAAVISEFRKEYGIVTDTCLVPDSSPVKNVGYVQRGMAELSTWDWMYGQTPEFTQSLTRIFSWGEVTAEIRCKHGIILHCELQVKDASITSPEVDEVSHFGHNFYKNKRYGFLHEAEDKETTRAGTASSKERSQPMLDVKAWLKEAM